MDSTDREIEFDANGVCNHCRRFESLFAEKVVSGERRQQRLAQLVESIKAAGHGATYDCVIGVSGGVDSTYLAYAVKELGLRPLAVHLDNGWDSELAVSNIEKTLSELGIDLHTHVIDWEEFRDLQMAFLLASTPDAEVPTDHAILAILYRVAARYGVRHILIGTNVASEAIMPITWGYGYFDLKYIKAVHRRFGKRSMKTYPTLSLPRLSYYSLVRKMKLVSILNYLDYDKPAAMERIERDLGWVYYGGKHYESIYTRFFQGYILPEKFDIDKRKAHLSNLICAGAITREQALVELEGPPYPEPQAREDYDYVVKKLGINAERFEEIMAMPTKTFYDYPTHHALVSRLKTLLNLRRRIFG